MDPSIPTLRDVLNRLAAIDAAIQTLVQQKIAKDWYTTAKVANLLGRKEYTVREWCRLKRILAEKRGSGRGPHAAWVVSHAELLRYQRDGLLPIR
ncbi:helix-turn-helix domain-containing protein [Fimbriiglobus ruber]|uniref:helix-turn-helix domain-containing protein n=1 Tax=Fimbriiglobus ruber TaxID=1908690 RepID=UPI001EE742B4|nr:helix-turn-helix domain-containing protein [Fimbriiglobus ruber]